MEYLCCLLLWTHLWGATHLEAVDQVHKIYTLRIPHYTILTCIGSSPSSIRTTTVILDTDSGYKNIFCSALPLGWQRYVRPEFYISPVGDTNGNLLQFSSAVFYQYDIEVLSTGLSYWVLSIQCGSTHWYSNLNHYVNSIICIDQQVDCSESKTLLFKSALRKATVRRMAMLDNGSGLTTDASTKAMYFFSDIVHHTDALSKTAILPLNTQFRESLRKGPEFLTSFKRKPTNL